MLIFKFQMFEKKIFNSYGELIKIHKKNNILCIYLNIKIKYVVKICKQLYVFHKLL